MVYTNVKETFDQLYKNFNPQAAKGVDAVFQWEIIGDGGGSWHMTVKDQACQLAEGKHPKPNVAQTSSVQTFLALVNKELGGMQAFMSGKLKVRGNILLAQKIMDIWPA